jgi:transcriptional regulator with XRE-family HTH domain
MTNNNTNGVLEINSKMVIRGKTIKTLRTIKERSLTDVSEVTDINIATLSAMENEKRSLSMRNQIKLTRYLLNDLGYTPDEVVVIQAFINHKEG